MDERSAQNPSPRVLELGGDEGWVAFLECRPGEPEPAILLRKDGPRGRTHPPEVIAYLDPALPVGRTTCPRCGARQAGWPRFCGVCRADLAPISEDPQADLVLPHGYEHLGPLQRAEGGGPLHFAREVATGRVVGMVEKPAPDGSVDLVPVWVATPTEPGRRRWRNPGAAVAVLAALLIAALLIARGLPVAAPGTDPVPKADTAATLSGARDTAGAPAGGTPDARSGGGSLPVAPTGGKVATPAGEGAGTPPRRTGGERVTPPSVTVDRPPPVAPPAPTPQGVEAAIRSYASAVGSGQTRRIARVYPGITAAEVERWNRFFAPLGPGAGLQADYEVVSGPTLQGNRAEVIFTLTLSYTNAAGAPAGESLPLRALLQWTGTEWSLQEVRLLQ
ncbi:MAG TPA: hypothetical protein VEQ60_31430 [Longimicrobium sp.]|nr:hypothetical protein [Longimicrobium sp.]